MTTQGDPDQPDKLPPQRLRLAHLLEAESTRRRLSSYEAADIFGVNQSTYYRWETGQSVPGRDFVPALAEFLNLPVETVYRLRLGDNEDAPETSEGNALRLQLLERDRDEMRDAIAEIRGQLATLTDMATRWFANHGPPGPSRRPPSEN